MKRTVQCARRSAFFRRALSLLLCVCGVFMWLIAAQAQAYNNRQDARGVALPAQTPTPPPATDAQGHTISKPELVLQTGYTYAIQMRMVFSPDGRLLATTTWNSSQVKLWEVATGRELRTFIGSSGAGNSSLVAFTGVSTIAFSHDSRLLAAGGHDGSIKVWDVTNGREVATIAGGQQDARDNLIGVYWLAFSPDGQTLVAYNGSATKVYEVTTGRELRTLDIGVPTDAGSTQGHIALTADGRQLIIIASDIGRNVKSSIKFIDLATGSVARTLPLPEDGGRANGNLLAQTPDGRLISAGFDLKPGDEESQIKLWDFTAKTKGRTLLTIPHGRASFADLSPDGRLLAIAVGNTVKLWDATTGSELRAFDVPNRLAQFAPDAGISALAFSPDAQLLATSGLDGQITLWDTTTGRVAQTLKGGTNYAYEASFSPDGTRLYTGAKTVWDLSGGRGLRASSVAADLSFGALLSPDGRLLAARTYQDRQITLYDATTNRQLQTLAPDEQAKTNLTVFSPDGRLLAATYTLDAGQMPTLKAKSQGDVMKAVKEAEKASKKDPAALQRNLMQAMYGNGPSTTIQNQVKIWDTQTGREVRSINVPSAFQYTQFVVGTVGKVAFSPDGRTLAVTPLMSNTVTLWDVATGQQLRTFGSAAATNPAGATDPYAAFNGTGFGSATVSAIAFSPDGRFIATGGREVENNFDPSAMMAAAMANARNPKAAAQTQAQMQAMAQNMLRNAKTSGPLHIWDVATGQEVRTLRGHEAEVKAIAFSADGRLLASAATDDTLKLWDATTGRELATLKGQNAEVNSLAFSPDNSLLVSTANDGSTYLWDAKTGQHLATLISLFNGDDWLVITPDGLFDGSPNAWNQILWRYDENTYNVAPIEWFFNEFFYPGLLSDLVAGKRPHAAQNFADKDRRQPVVKVTLADADASAPIATRNVRVKIDVQEAAPDATHSAGSGARDLRLFRNGSLVKVWHGDVLKGQQSVTLETTLPLMAGANRLTAYAFNRDNIKSRDATLPLTGADSLRRTGTAYVLAIGINEYANPQYNLKYAVPDAQEFGTEVERQQSKLGRYVHVEVVTLLNNDATKANIMAALAKLAQQTQPEDEIIVYFAGHGTAQANRFYLIPHDLGYTGSRTLLNPSGLRSILTHSISDQELEDAFEQVNAGQILFVIDACNSGQALEAEEKRRGPMNSKGLAQLAYEKGMYILTAAQSFQAAQEVSQLGHGLLTYVLVDEGLKQGLADDEPKDGMVLAREWIDYATNRVPAMQMEKVRQARDLSFAADDTRGLDLPRRVAQRPRPFYRRELETQPIIVAKP